MNDECPGSTMPISFRLRWVSAIVVILLALAGWSWRKELLFLLQPERPVAEVAQPVLWRISKAGVADSWLFGTQHVPDGRSSLLLRRIEPQLASARLLLTEHAMFSAEEEAAMQAFLYPRQERARTALASDTAALNAALRVRQVSPDVQATLNARQIFALLYLNHPRRGPVLDVLIATQAITQGLPYRGLETMASKLAVFDVLSEEEAARLSAYYLAHSGQLDRCMDEMTDAYYQRRLVAQHDLATCTVPADLAKLWQRLDRVLLEERNRAWLPVLLPELTDGNVIVAVGYMHLPRDAGVVALLRKAGYTLTPVY